MLFLQRAVLVIGLLLMPALVAAQSNAGGSGGSGGGGGPATQSGAWNVGLTGSLPAFAATPTFNVGTIAGIATETGVQAVRAALGSPFQAGGSIGNTAFGISGTLPAFASTPTFNVGTTNGLALDATVTARLGTLGQKAMAGSAPVTIASDQASIATKADQTTPGVTNGVALNLGSIAGGIATFVEFAQPGASVGPFAVKAGPGRVFKISGNNASAGPRRLRVYDALAANVTVGTTAPKFSRILPAGAAFSFDFSDIGASFSTGISFSLVQNAALTDASAPAASDITDVSWAIQ